MSDPRLRSDYYVGQRFHGLGSRVFRYALTRVPLSDQWMDDCSQCGHMLFVQRSVRKLHEDVPLLCTQCALEAELGEGVDVSTFLNLEACPPGCYYVRRNA
jgi:hypothetical protein